MTGRTIKTSPRRGKASRAAIRKAVRKVKALQEAQGCPHSNETEKLANTHVRAHFA